MIREKLCLSFFFVDTEMKEKWFTIFVKQESIYRRWNRFITISVKSRTFVLSSHGPMNHPLNIFLLKQRKKKKSDTESEQKHVWPALFNSFGRDTVVDHTHTHTEVRNTTPEHFLLNVFLSICALQGSVSTVIAFWPLFHGSAWRDQWARDLWLIGFPACLFHQSVSCNLPTYKLFLQPSALQKSPLWMSTKSLLCFILCILFSECTYTCIHVRSASAGCCYNTPYIHMQLCLYLLNSVVWCERLCNRLH